MKEIECKWEVRKRMETIERCLLWGGSLGRQNLTVPFGISLQQASADISRYQKWAPNNMEFNKSTKRYTPSESFAPAFISSDIDDYLAWQERKPGTFAKIETPWRHIDSSVFSVVTQAITKNLSFSMVYQSLTQKDPSERRFTPHTIVSDGFRYHVRGYCHLRDSFRDFVLGRITKAVPFGEPGLDKSKDDEWNTLLILRIGPHPDLTLSQKAIIESDYGMQNHELSTRVRQATLLYTLTQLRLDTLSSKRPPEEQQIVLLNRDDLIANQMSNGIL
jgi:hypothetical protein